MNTKTKKKHVNKGDVVSIEGWKGEYKVADSGFYSASLGKYIITVEANAPGISHMKVPLAETKVIDKAPESEQPPEETGKPWYLYYKDISPRKHNINKIVILDFIANSIKEASQPGQDIVRVKVELTNGKSTSFVLSQSSVVSENMLVCDADWNSKEALGSVICAVRAQLVRRLA